MLRIHCTLESLLKRPRSNAGASDAAHAQYFGYMQLLTRTLGTIVCRASEIMHLQAKETMGTALGGPSPDDSSAEVTIGHTPTLSAPLNSFADAEKEFIRSMATGINATNEPDTMGIVDLIDYWKVCSHLLVSFLANVLNHPNDKVRQCAYRLNVLPAQASAVSSERIFSPSKTCTSERSRLSDEIMEHLQALKHSLVRHRRTRESIVRRDDEVFDFITHLFENLGISTDDE
ncbi:hypothetical protein FRC11_003396 [Ceratobasidium sp. 423]|nr:hypothetical protein FRC11_003396 [Ceratobasidium sp. 423]